MQIEISKCASLLARYIFFSIFALLNAVYFLFILLFFTSMAYVRLRFMFLRSSKCGYMKLKVVNITWTPLGLACGDLYLMHFVCCMKLWFHCGKRLPECLVDRRDFPVLREPWLLLWCTLKMGCTSGLPNINHWFKWLTSEWLIFINIPW